MSTLRAEQLKAGLKDASPHALEKALIEAVVRGQKWRIDATFDVIERNEKAARHILMGVDLFANLGRFGRLDAIKRIEKTCPFLFDKHVRPPNVPPQMTAAFEQAVMHGHFDIADLCRRYGASGEVDLRFSGISHVVFATACDPDVRKVEYLLASGCQPEVCLFAAIGTNNIASVRRLLDLGIDVNSEKTIDDSPLCQAIRHSYVVGADPVAGIAMTKFLLSRGARLKGPHELEYVMMQLNHQKCTKMIEVLAQAGIGAQRPQAPSTKFNP